MERPINGKWIAWWVFLALCIIALWTVFYWLPPQQENPQQEESAVVSQKEEGEGGESARKKAQEPQFVELPEHLRYLRHATVRIRAGMVEGSGVVVRQEGNNTFILTLGYVVEEVVSKTGEKVTGFVPAQIIFCQEDGDDRRDAMMLRYTGGSEEPALLRTSYGKCVRPITWSDGVIDVLHVNTGSIAPGTTAGRIPIRRKLGGIVVYDTYQEMGVVGSGGGGVFRKEDGTCLGLLSRGGGGITLAIPTDTIVQWAKDQGVAWAIDHTIPVPSEEELKKLPTGILRD